MSELNYFQKHLPDAFIKINQELLRQGFVATVVGGVVRDYFLTGAIGKDWDLEITHPSLVWELTAWKQLAKDVGRNFRVTHLPYDVIRIDSGDGYIFELSPPRIENFSDENHHKNFTVDFDYRLPFEKAVERRDFTINSMGLRVDSEGQARLIDPLNGLLHLRDKELCASGSDFSRDPVRFLRAIRFSVKLQFRISDSLRQIMNKMDTSGLSPSYLWSELQKSLAPIKFYQRLLEEKEIHPELILPTGDVRSVIPELSKLLKHPLKHESWIIALEWEGIDGESWQSFFGLSSESSRRLGRWASSTKKFSKIMPEEFHGEFEEVLKLKDFELLFDWYFTTKQILQKNSDLALVEMIESYLPQWGHLYKFEPLKDVKHIDPPLRAKYQVWNLCQRL